MERDDATGLCTTDASRQYTKEVLRRVGDTWSLATIARLTDGPHRFTELMKDLPGISHRMLTQTLRSLQRDGLVSRTAYAEVPPRVEYALTPLGHSMLEPLTELTKWAEDTLDQVADHRRTFDT
ncbi:HxlR family transcriptional regulator [Kribbella sp. VKM Ac-2527]|uniref:HxlR family transcriptional regulator n=1 Tax=Kribbella caucasensis TaxID=2512215 RepID=A0A4R6J5F0_9ACTN|nr:helix-turn-helix domain-containing protein [Kribbella sp. VKM Ac-2527]TDO30643.1 HxlR family transcriptional regulator [Kribbella sp. VKM Ac-2527]